MVALNGLISHVEESLLNLRTSELWMSHMSPVDKIIPICIVRTSSLFT